VRLAALRSPGVTQRTGKLEFVATIEPLLHAGPQRWR